MASIGGILGQLPVCMSSRWSDVSHVLVHCDEPITCRCICQPYSGLLRDVLHVSCTVHHNSFRMLAHINTVV